MLRISLGARVVLIVVGAMIAVGAGLVVRLGASSVALNAVPGNYDAPAHIALDASVRGGSFTQVNFYANDKLVATAQSTPYSATWRDVPAGQYSVVAAGVSAGGSLTYSDAVQITVTPPPPDVTAANVRTLPLVQQSALRYDGAFRFPTNFPPHSLGPEASTFNYGGTFAFNPRRNSLYGVGHAWHQRVAEFTIPELRTGSIDGLLRGEILQNFGDPVDGKIESINPGDSNQKMIGGLLPWDDRLIVSAYAFYDAGGTQVRSHFVSSQDLSAPADAQGPYRLDAKAGYVSGYMAPVPVEWRAALGGPAFTGQCCLSIISRTSYGPALFTFDPAHLGTKDPVPATPLLYYPPEHRLGVTEANNPYFNLTTTTTGVVIPRGSRSVLFFGRHGTGTPCYGTGTECKDPEFESKGQHAYPYVYRVLAYDGADLIEVRRGKKKPWEVTPYAAWDLNLPHKGAATTLNAATYDPASGRLIIVPGYADVSGPLFLVYGFDVK